MGGGVAGVLSEGDFLPQTESVVAARTTANAVARERGPNFIHTSNRRAATGGPGIPEGITPDPPGARKNTRRARGLHPVPEDSPEGEAGQLRQQRGPGSALARGTDEPRQPPHAARQFRVEGRIGLRAQKQRG